MEAKQANMSSVLWQSVLGEIEVSVSPANFRTWFKNTSLLEQAEDSIVVGVANPFAKRQFEEKFNRMVLDVLKRHGVKVEKVYYRVKPSSPTTTANQTVLSQPAKPVQRVVSGPVRTNYGNLNSRYTFDDFVVGSSNELAYAACQVIAKEPGVKYNPLFVYGGVGLGKTHLIQAVGNEILRRDPNSHVEYITSERFSKEFIAAILSKRTFSNHYRSVDVLIVDDMQFIAGKEKTQEEFFHTFNTLHQANKQIIISSDKAPKAIPTLEERLSSRFEWGMTIDIQPPDFETRVAILQSKARRTNLNFNAEILEYLANHIQSNIRELEGALTKLVAFCEMRGTTPSLEMAEHMISPSKTPMRHITPKQIIDKTARFFNLSSAELTSSRRVKEIVEPRQVAMYLMRTELQLSYPQIAKNVGRSDHTTAIHSIHKIENSLQNNQNLRAQILDLKDKLYV